MENLFSGNFQLFQKKEKKECARKNQKKMGGAREARFPLIFFIFSFIFHFQGFGNVRNFQKTNFAFFHFFDFFLNFEYFFLDFY